MPRSGYITRNPRPNVRDQGYEAVAKNLHERMRRRAGRFYCFVLPSGTTYLRATTENRTDLPSMAAWIGTYNTSTPIEMIESDLLERLRELNSQALAA